MIARVAGDHRLFLPSAPRVRGAQSVARPNCSVTPSASPAGPSPARPADRVIRAAVRASNREQRTTTSLGRAAAAVLGDGQPAPAACTRSALALPSDRWAGVGYDGSAYSAISAGRRFQVVFKKARRCFEFYDRSVHPMQVVHSVREGEGGGALAEWLSKLVERVLAVS